EEAKSFYEDIFELTAHVPGVLLESNRKLKKDNTSAGKDAPSIQELDKGNEAKEESNASQDAMMEMLSGLTVDDADGDIGDYGQDDVNEDIESEDVNGNERYTSPHLQILI